MELFGSTVSNPAGAGRRAQLLLVLLLLSVFPIVLLTIPIQTHAVKLDLPRLPEASAVPFPYDYVMPDSIRPAQSLEPVRRLHTLVVTSQDRVLIDGRAVGFASLRSRLDSISLSDGEWVDFRPEPEARYEMVLEVLAVTRRARLERLRLDSRPFRDAIERGSAVPWLSR